MTGNPEAIKFAISTDKIDGVVMLAQAEIRTRDIHTRTLLRLCSLQQRLWRRRLTDHEWNTITENPGFFNADLLARITEPGLVIERDIGDDGDIGLHDIDRIETTAETDFQDLHIDIFAIKNIERGECAKFEIGQGGFGTVFVAPRAVDTPEL